MEGATTIPSGLAGIASDFRHYCRVHGAKTWSARLLLPLTAPSFVALAVYRYGRWSYEPARKGPFARLFRLLYVALFELSRHYTGILLHPWAEVEEEVWIESFAPVFVGARRIGRGSRIFGGVTLGAGGTREARGVPELGRGVVIGPGAIVTGPVRIPDGSVIGPNALLTNSPAATSAWMGVPALRWRKAPELLIPAGPSGGEP